MPGGFIVNARDVRGMCGLAAGRRCLLTITNGVDIVNCAGFCETWCPASASRQREPPPPMKIGRAKNMPLRDACIVQALEIIGSDGLEALSLREVARRLNVSHQAPYKHFESRDHILAEAVGRAFATFAAYLEKRKRRDEPLEDLASLGATYIRYARQHPAHYRLMFGAPLPDPGAHPEMMRMAKVPFKILRDAIARLPGSRGTAGIERDALFAWATVHGLASILETKAGEQLGLHSQDVEKAVAHTLRRIGTAMMAR